MKRLLGPIALALALGTATASASFAPKGDPLWRLQQGAYPSGATVIHLNPTNKNMQRMFGSDHGGTYADMGRQNGKGWLQQAVGPDADDPAYAFTYGVSYYASPEDAAQAVADVGSVLQNMQGLIGVGSYGQGFRGEAGEYYLIFNVFAEGSITVEQGCFVKLTQRAKYADTLNHYCAREGIALAQTLKSMAGPENASVPAAPIP